MLNFRKKFTLIITSIIILVSILLAVSCEKATDPSYESSLRGMINTTTNTNINNKLMTVYSGPHNYTLNVSYENILTIWRKSFFEKTIYQNSQMNSITGWTDTNGNYHDGTSSTARVRTSLRGVGLTTYQGRVTVCGIYYDETSSFGNRWRKIIVTPDYVEQAWYGAYIPATNNDGSLQDYPADFYFDDKWVIYNFIFGVMEH